MLVNLFFFTVTISKRKYSKKEIEHAYNLCKTELQVEKTKLRTYEQQIRFM